MTSEKPDPDDDEMGWGMAIFWICVICGIVGLVGFVAYVVVVGSNL